MATNSFTSYSYFFLNISITSYSVRFPGNHPHPTVVFSRITAEEKAPAFKSSKKKPAHVNGVGSPSHDFKSTSPATPISKTHFGVLRNLNLRALPADLCNAVDDFINNYLEKVPLRPWVDPRLVLADNFSPVEETGPVECVKIEGTLPACLDGVYIRNGPNPRFMPTSGHHLFDGDGMLHAIRFKNGRATLCSRFVRTHKFVQEDMAGRPLMPNVFSNLYTSGAALARGLLLAVRLALGQFDISNGVGLANTSVLYFNHKFMALAESDLPYVVRLTSRGDVETVGRSGFDDRRQFMCMTAHPKIDPGTGELFAFRYGPFPPFLNYFRVLPTGEKEPDVEIWSMRRPSFIHDFAITKQYAIFPDTQIVVKVMDMILGRGSLVGCDAAKVPRLGVLPRYATDEAAMKWLEVPGLNFFHSLNAWDEGDEIVLIVANSCPVEHVLERIHLVHSTVEMVRINLTNGTVSREPLSSKCLEFGVINPRFVAKKNRYAYMSIGAPLPKLCGVVKLDFDMVKATAAKECVVASRLYGEGCFGSEPFFVSRTSDLEAEEDDGYIAAFVHNEGTGISSFVVMDAQSPTLEIVASVELPVRVPYGFHGLFVSDRVLRNQSES